MQAAPTTNIVLGHTLLFCLADHVFALTWLFAAAPMDRFLGPKETHALKIEKRIQLLHLSFKNKLFS